MTTTVEEEPPQPQFYPRERTNIPRKRFGHNIKYAKGYTFYKKCSLWLKPGAEKRDENEKQRIRCPDCNALVRTRPPASSAKERLVKKITGKELVRY